MEVGTATCIIPCSSTVDWSTWWSQEYCWITQVNSFKHSSSIKPSTWLHTWTSDLIPWNRSLEWKYSTKHSRCCFTIICLSGPTFCQPKSNSSFIWGTHSESFWVCRWLSTSSSVFMASLAILFENTNLKRQKPSTIKRLKKLLRTKNKDNSNTNKIFEKPRKKEYWRTKFTEQSWCINGNFKRQPICMFLCLYMAMKIRCWWFSRRLCQLRSRRLKKSWPRKTRRSNQRRSMRYT